MAVTLVGRDVERATIDRLLSRAGAGMGGALVLRGEAGVGKSALLEYAAESAVGAGMRVARIVGVQSEANLAYAGLVSLLRPFLGLLSGVPEPQARSLRGALGLAELERVDRLLIGQGVLTLLSEAAETEATPLVCLVDDGQWVDQESVDALLFASRRLEVEPIAILLAVRDDERPTASGPDDIAIAALDRSASRELLSAYAPGLDAVCFDRVLSEAQGNPLALREFAEMTLAGQPLGLQLSPLPISERLENRFADQVDQLPASARQLLLLAAASGNGEIHLVTSAAEHLGGLVGDSEPAEKAGLVRVSDQAVVFRHPLIRSAVYYRAPLQSRLAAHRALAQVLDPATDRDRRAWHAAWSITEPNEEIAADLELTADHARRAGGYAALAAAYERAAELTPDQQRRAHRQAEAAQAALLAGRREQANALAAQAAAVITDSGARARLEVVRLKSLRIVDHTPALARQPLLEHASSLSEEHPVDAARYFYEALLLALMLEPTPAAIRAVVEEMRRARLPDLPDVRPFVGGVEGVADLYAGRCERAMPRLRALAGWLGAASSEPHPVTATVFGPAATAMLAGDLVRVREAAVRTLEAVRRCGAYELLPTALGWLGMGERAVGRLWDAEASMLSAIDQAGREYRVEVPHLKAELIFFAALRGDEESARQIAHDVYATAMATTAPMAAECELAFLEIGLGHYETALIRLQRLFKSREPYVPHMYYSQPLLVEAAAFAGVPESGGSACRQFTAWASATGTTWAQSISLRCQAILAPDTDAGDLYQRSVDLGQPDGSPFEQARTELLYGTWLRRTRRIRDARTMLRPALETFDCLGATLWADRARSELRAAGDTTYAHPSHIPEGRQALTPQEFKIARLAAKGMRNRDIAAHLHLSHRTVGYHLYKIFPKLGISSRNELAHLDLDNA